MISGIIGFVTDTIVKKAIPKLIGMFIPGAGFIPAIISIYDTIMVFVQKISKIIQVVTAFIDSIVTIAAGNITRAPPTAWKASSAGCCRSPSASLPASSASARSPTRSWR